MAYEGTTLDDRYELVNNTISNAGKPNLRSQLKLPSNGQLPPGLMQKIINMGNGQGPNYSMDTKEARLGRKFYHSGSYSSEEDREKHYSFVSEFGDGQAVIVTVFPNRHSLDDITYQDMRAITASGSELARLFSQDESLEGLVQVYKITKRPESKSLMIRGYTLPATSDTRAVADDESRWVEMLMKPGYGVETPLEAFKQKSEKKELTFHWDEFSQLSVPYDVLNPRRIDADTRIARLEYMNPEERKYVGENMRGAVEVLLRDPAVQEIAIVVHEARKGKEHLNRVHYHIIPKVSDYRIPQPAELLGPLRNHYSRQKPPEREPMPKREKERVLVAA
ncbi:hypothetical protein J4227_04590 [Candidatus Woesearchaeota archaeon]|nr:hypothetical protein [Candidatus Woesearchaeota archaeon]